MEENGDPDESNFGTIGAYKVGVNLERNGCLSRQLSYGGNQINDSHFLKKQ